MPTFTDARHGNSKETISTRRIHKKLWTFSQKIMQLHPQRGNINVFNKINNNIVNTSNYVQRTVRRNKKPKNSLNPAVTALRNESLGHLGSRNLKIAPSAKQGLSYSRSAISKKSEMNSGKIFISCT